MQAPLGRRHFLRGAATLAGGLLTAAHTGATTPTPATITRPDLAADALARDEAFWQQVRQQYWLPQGVTQLENGNWGVMAKPVLEAYQQHTFRVNRNSSYFSRRTLGAELATIREQVAATLGAAPGEIAFTRGATEVLQNLISGYRQLAPGDAVLYADTDYDSMQSAMAWLGQRRGVEVVTLQLPERASQAELLAAYRQALDANPKVRLLLLTHLSHRHGLILPVQEIVAMARTRKVDCIIDAAHSWGQIDFNVNDLQADFVGFNLHKWMGAPIGVGVMYIRKERLDAIAPYLGDTAFAEDDIRARVHTGTSNIAALLAVPDALAFHHQIGGVAKQARLRYLRDYWVQRTRDLPGMEVLTLNGPEDHAGISAFRLHGRRDSPANRTLARRLLDEHGVFTVHRDGLAGGSCVRVTPALFTSTGDLDRLVSGLTALAGT